MREKIMATFRDWLRDQEQRDDQTGWTAKYWRDLPDTPRLSSPNSIERHMAQRGLFESQPGLKEAWDAAFAEYRQHRIVVAAVDAGVQPGQLPATVPAGERSAPHNAYTGWPQQYLERMTAMLEAICGRMGIELPQLSEPDETPIDWQALWEQAQAEQQAAGE